MEYLGYVLMTPFSFLEPIDAPPPPPHLKKKKKKKDEKGAGGGGWGGAGGQCLVSETKELASSRVYYYM